MWMRRRGRDLFRPHELAVLDAVRTRLDPSAATLLDRQVASFELIQRMFDDRDVYCYPNRRGPQRRDPAIAFPNTSESLRLATVTVRGVKGDGRVHVDGVLGHLFQLTFTPGPKQLGPVRSIEVRSVTLRDDPMVGPPDGGLEQRLAALDPGTRRDLERLWSDGSATELGLASPDELYQVDLDDGDHLVLAQLDDTSFLVAPVDPARPGVRRYWPDGDLVREYPDVGAALADR